jgi:hypothetical protein
MKRHYLSSLEALEFSVFEEAHSLLIYPIWMVRYFEALTEKEQWQYFLTYREVASQMVNESYLIDQLKWILKLPSIELEYNLYVQASLDPDFYEADVFRPGKWDRLHEKYATRFRQEVSLVMEQQQEDLASSQDEPEDKLPF